MNEQTLEKMKQMKLYGMLRSFKNVLESSTMNQLTADELILQLIENEWEDRHSRAVERSITVAIGASAWPPTANETDMPFALRLIGEAVTRVLGEGDDLRCIVVEGQ